MLSERERHLPPRRYRIIPCQVMRQDQLVIDRICHGYQAVGVQNQGPVFLINLDPSLTAHSPR